MAWASINPMKMLNVTICLLLIDFKPFWILQWIFKFHITCHVTMSSLVLIHWGIVQKSTENVNKWMGDKCLVCFTLTGKHCVNKMNFTNQLLAGELLPRKSCGAASSPVPSSGRLWNLPHCSEPAQQKAFLQPKRFLLARSVSWISSGGGGSAAFD